MEKYLIIIVVFIGLYFLYTKCVQGENESFANESFANESIVNESFANESFQNITLGSADDQNAINKLAQIATKLMEGGLTVPGNMTVQGNMNIQGDVFFPKPIALRGEQRLHISAGEHLYLLPKNNVIISKAWGGEGHLNVEGNTATGGNINARIGDFNTRIGHVWTAPGIYAESGKNLEIGAGSGNIFIGAANGGANQNLIVTGNISTGVNVWNTSRDGQNRTYYENNGRTFYGSANGLHTFRTGGNGGGQDLVTIGNNKLQLEGRLFIRRPNMKAADGYDGPGQIGGTSSIDDCAQKCVDRAPQTQVAMRRKTDGYCWCKDANVYMHPSNDVDSMITY